MIEPLDRLAAMGCEIKPSLSAENITLEVYVTNEKYFIIGPRSGKIQYKFSKGALSGPYLETAVRFTTDRTLLSSLMVTQMKGAYIIFVHRQKR